MRRAKCPDKAATVASLHGAARVILIAGSVAVFASCAKNTGTFDQPDTVPVTTKLANLLSFNKSADAPPEKAAEKLECPEIIVLDGTVAHRVYNGPESNETLRYQYSIGDVARECIKQGDQIAMKVGVEGLVLLGPAGAPSAFTVPIRIAVVREADGTAVMSKLYNASVSIPPGQSEGTFMVVTEPLLAPFIQQHTAIDYSIKVGIDAGGSTPAPAAHTHKKRDS